MLLASIHVNVLFIITGFDYLSTFNVSDTPFNKISRLSPTFHLCHHFYWQLLAGTSNLDCHNESPLPIIISFECVKRGKNAKNWILFFQTLIF